MHRVFAVNPHILTAVRAALMREGVITETRHSGPPWYHLTRKPKAEIDRRLGALARSNEGHAWDESDPWG